MTSATDGIYINFGGLDEEREYFYVGHGPLSRAQSHDGGRHPRSVWAPWPEAEAKNLEKTILFATRNDHIPSRGGKSYRYGSMTLDLFVKLVKERKANSDKDTHGGPGASTPEAFFRFLRELIRSTNRRDLVTDPVVFRFKFCRADRWQDRASLSMLHRQLEHRNEDPIVRVANLIFDRLYSRAEVIERRGWATNFNILFSQVFDMWTVHYSEKGPPRQPWTRASFNKVKKNGDRVWSFEAQIELLQQLEKDLPDLLKRQVVSLEELFNIILAFHWPLVGGSSTGDPFMAFQVTADLGKLLNLPEDWALFRCKPPSLEEYRDDLRRWRASGSCIFRMFNEKSIGDGPTARHDALVYARNLCAGQRQYLVAEDYALLGKDNLSIIDIEHISCERDKHERLVCGITTSRDIYRPSEKPKLCSLTKDEWTKISLLRSTT